MTKEKRKVEVLCDLVRSGHLKDYEVVNLSANNIEGEVTDTRNSDRLKLTFPDGRQVIVTAITTGMEDDALLRFE